MYLRFLKTIERDNDAVLYKVYGFITHTGILVIATVFVPTVLEAARQKPHAVPYLNCSA